MRLTIVTMLIEAGIILGFSTLLLILSITMVAYLFVIMYAGAYTRPIDNAGAILCELTSIYAMVIPSLHQYLPVS